MGVPGAGAFDIKVHQQMNDAGFSGHGGRFLRKHVEMVLRQMHWDIDHGLEAAYDERHFDDCGFNEGARYIRDQFASTRKRLGDPSRVWDATNPFGRGLHPTQDFYAHSNWVEMGFPGNDLSNTPDIEADLSDLVDLSGAQSSLSKRWFAPGFGEVVRDDILLGADDGGFIPTSWSIEREGAGRHVPTLTDAAGRVRGRLLVSGMSTTDSECTVWSQTPAGLARRFKGFSHEGLNKDSPSQYPLHQRGRAIATLQTSYEWCRLVREAAVAKTDGVLLAMWIRNGASPHPAGTPCAAAPPGPKEVTVAVEKVRVKDNGDQSGAGEVQLATALYDDPADFHRSIHQTTSSVSLRDGRFVPSNRLPDPMTVCVDADDGATFALHAWDNDQDDDDHVSDATDFDDHHDDDELLPGFQRRITEPGSLAPTSYRAGARSGQLEILYRVTAGPPNPSCPQPRPPGTPKPDLVISDFKIDEFTVLNQGAAPAGPFTVTLAGFDQFGFAGLAAGATARVAYPGNCEAEHRATADSDAEVDEADETNNVATFTTVC